MLSDELLLASQQVRLAAIPKDSLGLWLVVSLAAQSLTPYAIRLQGTHDQVAVYLDRIAYGIVLSGHCYQWSRAMGGDMNHFYNALDAKGRVVCSLIPEVLPLDDAA